MRKFLKENWKFLLFVLIGGLVGGYCTGLYVYDALSADFLKQLQEQNVTKELVAISTMVQYGILFGVIFAAIGIIISKKVNLWKEIKYNKQACIATTLITIIAALLLFPGDKLIFGPFSSWVNDQYNITPTLEKTIAGLLTGGIIEEIMIRLFVMSLLVLIISKIFFRNAKEILDKIYIIANIISALLFAAGHIPATIAMTVLTPSLLFRCFLLNGVIGLGFGYLYRKYGIVYAIISHGCVHLVADVLVIILAIIRA